MERKLIKAVKQNSGSKALVTHLSAFTRDPENLSAACNTEADGWVEVAPTWEWTDDAGQTFTYKTTVGCKKCRKYER